MDDHKKRYDEYGRPIKQSFFSKLFTSSSKNSTEISQVREFEGNEETDDSVFDVIEEENSSIQANESKNSDSSTVSEDETNTEDTVSNKGNMFIFFIYFTLFSFFVAGVLGLILSIIILLVYFKVRKK
jgi:hypothetical protein